MATTSPHGLRLPPAPPPGRIGRCTFCSLTLPLLLPVPAKPAATWGCKCGAEYKGLLDADASLELMAAVQLLKAPRTNFRLPKPPGAGSAHLQDIPPIEPSAQTERRRCERHPRLIPYAAVPIDGAMLPIDDVFCGFTRNISSSGVALLANRSVDKGLILLELWNAGPERLRLLLKAIDCRTFGALFEIAGPLLMRIGI